MSKLTVRAADGTEYSISRPVSKGSIYSAPARALEAVLSKHTGRPAEEHRLRFRSKDIFGLKTPESVGAEAGDVLELDFEDVSKAEPAGFFTWRRILLLSGVVFIALFQFVSAGLGITAGDFELDISIPWLTKADESIDEVIKHREKELDNFANGGSAPLPKKVAVPGQEERPIEADTAEWAKWAAENTEAECIEVADSYGFENRPNLIKKHYGLSTQGCCDACAAETECQAWTSYYPHEFYHSMPPEQSFVCSLYATAANPTHCLEVNRCTSGRVRRTVRAKD